MHSSAKKVKHDLLTEEHTSLYHEVPFKFNAPHRYHVYNTSHVNGISDLESVKFQEGPIKENGVNGVNNEDLIAMVINRLEHFNQSEFSCRENAVAITKLEEALLWLRKRTMNREQRNVKGTSEK